MPEINLLKQKRSSPLAESLPSLVVKILAVVLVFTVGYYGWMFWRIKQVGKNIANLQQQLAQTKSSALNTKERDEVLTRQQQLKALDGLITVHPYWSHVLPELAKVTLKTASYSALTMTPDNVVSLTVRVPNIAELDKFLQVFDLPEFNKNFSDVRIGSFHNVQSNDTTAVEFDVKLKYNPALLQYQDASLTQK